MANKNTKLEIHTEEYAAYTNKLGKQIKAGTSLVVHIPQPYNNKATKKIRLKVANVSDYRDLMTYIKGL